MTTRNNFSKILKNGGLMLLGLIVVFGLSYGGYNYFHGNKSKTNKVISADKKAGSEVSEKKTSKSNVKSSNKQDSDKNKNIRHNVSEDGMKYTYDAQKVKDILDNKAPNDGKKIAFLTFDDGPSTTVTPIILNTLKNYNVKATFCLLGENVEKNEKSKELVKEILKEGHAIGNHTYTHSMRKLYPGNRLDVGTVMAEVEQDNTAIRNIVGQDFNTRVLRLPGGYMSRAYYHDPNLNEFNARLKEKGMYSIDWNAYDFDAEGRRKNADQLLEHVKRSVGSQQKVVILMHDTYGKEETARALPQIIEYLKDQGYEFKTIA
ncbi:polysaccharide deacetylase family protein [Clostridium coskatii]|uniref:Peptidoglycan-N-acetylglucosamine deacetylase n=1 Tax=Clostridium coskatii TaxID=1705578 RepID=A0A168N3Y9_9CLOT|nr:polysaccharide deacetylase family protein [Clostridium coskatii]OAA85729.1 Peptidoglycan-N-acetylglucosamine deacetylase [Clostridium coskatii]OBR91430.1 peptidoglycan-N-acetylglucosamine deacetylase [Clostridium coskatii]